MTSVTRGQTALIAYLRRRDLSQRDFAARLGLQDSMVSRLCAGERLPSLALAFEIERRTRGAVPARAWTLLARAS